MIISIFKDFKIFDAGSKTSVDEIIKKINITSNEVTLNLSRCIIDYPATSILIDKLLSDLAKTRKQSKLVIQTHLNILETLLLHWLFIGSTFFKIDDSKKKNSLEEFKSVINTKLISKKINIQIDIIDKKGVLLKQYTYGQK